MTKEPWTHDLELYNKDSLRDTTDDDRMGGGALDLGSSSHKSRSKAGMVQRDSFYMTAWEKWASSLSANG